jgi:hypothetical protein
MTTRISKIARLPRDIRDQLNRRLQDGELGQDLVVWLNSLPKVQALVKSELGGRPVTEQNLSDWRRAGYRDWLIQQETIEQVQRLVADAKEVAEVAKTPLSEQLATWLAARYAVAVRGLAAAEGNSVSDCEALRKLCHDVVELRRGDHSAQRLRLERERLDTEKAENRRNWEAEFLEWAKRPEGQEQIQREFAKRKKTLEWADDETIDKIRMTLFGSAARCRPIGETPAESNGQSSLIKPNPG